MIEQIGLLISPVAFSWLSILSETGTTLSGSVRQVSLNQQSRQQLLTLPDCFQDVQISRLEHVLAGTESTAPPASTGSKSTPSSQGQLVHFSCLTLPHFMALVSRPSAKTIPEKTALVVISDLSALVNSSLPKSIDAKSGNKGNRGGCGPRPPCL